MQPTVKMSQFDFKCMVAPNRPPELRPPLIPNLVHAVERVKKWRAAGVKNYDDELYYLTEVMKREIKRQGFTGRYPPRPIQMAYNLRQTYIIEPEPRGWFKSILYMIWPELF